MGLPGMGPDVVVIIGVMKGGSTTLFDRLAGLPEFARPRRKEPRFFSDDTSWRQGEPWYRDNLQSEGAVGLDASVDYTHPDRAAIAAERMRGMLRTPRLIVVLREPVERLRSHYLHEVQRGRERRTLAEALADAGNQYADRSRYDRCLAPYLDGPLADGLLAVRTEALDDPATWSRVVRHVGAQEVPLDTSRRNVSGDKAPMTGLGARLWKAGLLQQSSRLPAPIRRLGRSLAFGGNARSESASAKVDLPSGLAEDLRQCEARAWDRLSACGATA